MKLFLIKLAIILMCVPVYPFYVFFIHAERSRYYGSQSTIRKVNREYWNDVKDALLYRNKDK